LIGDVLAIADQGNRPGFPIMREQTQPNDLGISHQRESNPGWAFRGPM